MNEIPKLVFSKTPERAEWPASHIAAGGSRPRRGGSAPLAITADARSPDRSGFAAG
jgi:hypothetical protein